MATAEPVSLLQRVGDVEIWRVEELILPTSVRWLLPDAEREAVAETLSWLRPHFANDDGYLLQSIHTYVLKLPDRVVLIDTGVGNGKERTGGGIPAFHMLDTPFLERLAGAGVTPDDVDLVLCTHMHGDHVGWDAQLVDGDWRPTFPRARHVFARPEFEAFSQQAETQDATRRLMDDSIRPVMDAGLVDLVAVDHQVSPELRLEPSHGHSPGHVNVCLESRGERAVFIGDVMHSPVQCAFPELTSALGGNPEGSRQARLDVLNTYADSGTWVFGAHFSAPCAGLVRREGERRFRFDAYPG